MVIIFCSRSRARVSVEFQPGDYRTESSFAVQCSRDNEDEDSQFNEIGEIRSLLIISYLRFFDPYTLRL